MPVYLVAAYTVFLGGMAGLSLSIWLRHRRIEEQAEELQKLVDAADESVTPPAPLN